MGTLRQDLIRLLADGPKDIRDLSQSLGVREKEIHLHLPHVAKSVAARGGRLIVEPAVCRHCGYEFHDRRRLTPPGRCPKCRLTRIDGPRYSVQNLD